MEAERLSMRTIKEILRLKWENRFSNTQIALSCNIARSTIRSYLEREVKRGLPLRGCCPNARSKANRTML